MIQQTHPLDWIENVSLALKWSEEIPLWGETSHFDTGLWGEKMKAFLGLSSFKLEMQHAEILLSEKMTLNFGMNPVITPLTLSSLPGCAYLITATEDLSALSGTVLSAKGSIKGLSSSSFLEGFYRYLLLQVIHFVNGEEESVKPWKDLIVKIAPKTPLPEEPCLALDFVLKLPHKEILFRLLCPDVFQRAFKEHFKTPITQIPEEKTSKIPLILSCRIGQTRLNLEELDQLKKGDLLLLDECHYDPKAHKGTGTLCLNEHALFRVRFKDHQTKLTDYALYHEVPMEETPIDSENAGISVPQETVQEVIHKDQIPLTLVVEVARLKMDLSQLLKLQPGNILELPVHPEQGVSVLVNGKKIASGDLIKIGDSLGVKIHKMG